MGIDPIAEIFLQVNAGKITGSSGSDTKLKYDCVEYGCTEGIWHDDSLTNVLNDIEHKRLEVNKRLRNNTTADVLAGINFNNQPRCGLQATCLVDIKLQNFAYDLQCKDNSLTGRDGVPPHEHLHDNIYKIQDAYHETTEQDRKQRWSESGNVWAAPDVKYNNPFDPRLQFDGLLSNKKRKIADDTPECYLRDTFNPALNDPCPARFADEYLNKYRKFINDIGGDEKWHQVTGPNSNIGSVSHATTRKRLPVFVDCTNEDRYLWDNILSTRRLWKPEEDYPETIETKDDIVDPCTVTAAPVNNVNTIPVINTLNARVRGNRGRTQQQARARHLRDVTGVVTNDPANWETTNQRKQDIYEWLAGIQTGVEPSAQQPDASIADAAPPRESIDNANGWPYMFPVSSSNRERPHDRMIADQGNDIDVKATTDLEASEHALSGEQPVLRHEPSSTKPPRNNGPAQLQYRGHQPVPTTGDQSLQATKAQHQQQRAAEELGYQTNQREVMQQAPRTEGGGQFKVTNHQQLEVQTTFSRTAISTTSTTISSVRQATVTDYCRQGLASSQLSQQSCGQQSKLNSYRENVATTTTHTTKQSEAQHVTIQDNRQYSDSNQQSQHRETKQQPTGPNNSNQYIPVLQHRQNLSAYNPSGAGRQHDNSSQFARPVSAYQLLKQRSGAARTRQCYSEEPRQPSKDKECFRVPTCEVEPGRNDETPSVHECGSQSQNKRKHSQQCSPAESNQQDILSRQPTQFTNRSIQNSQFLSGTNQLRPSEVTANVQHPTGTGQIYKTTPESHVSSNTIPVICQQQRTSKGQRLAQEPTRGFATGELYKQQIRQNSRIQLASVQDVPNHGCGNGQFHQQRRQQQPHPYQDNSQQQPLHETLVPANTAIPSHTSMFWSHQQRQHSRERQQEQDNQLRAFDEQSTTGQQVQPSESGPAEHRNISYQEQQSHQQYLFCDPELSQSVHQKHAYQYQQRQVAGQRNEKAADTAQCGIHYGYRQYALPPQVGHGPVLEQYRYPPPPTFLSASGFSEPLYMPEVEDTGSLKFDDEVWYINGVPHQHARPFIPQSAVPETNPGPPLTDGSFSSTINPPFVPPSFMMYNAACYNHIPLLQPGQPRNNGYHLGTPLQLHELQQVNYNMNANPTEIVTENNTEKAIITESTRPNSVHSIDFIETDVSMKSISSSSMSDLQQVPSASSMDEADKNSSDTSAQSSATSNSMRFTDDIRNFDITTSPMRSLKWTPLVISPTECDNMIDAEFDDIKNHLSVRSSNNIHNTKHASHNGKTQTKGRKIRVIRHNSQNWTRHSVKFQSKKPARPMRSSLITIL